MTDCLKFDRDTLYDRIWETVGARIGYGIDCDVLTDQVCDAVMKWVPKQGDFWLDQKSGTLYVNEGWKVVTVEGIE